MHAQILRRRKHGVAHWHEESCDCEIQQTKQIPPRKGHSSGRHVSPQFCSVLYTQVLEVLYTNRLSF